MLRDPVAVGCPLRHAHPPPPRAALVAPDVIKSKLQVDSYERPRYCGIADCARQTLAADGIKGLFRGFAPALLRSFPANAVCFAAYEATKSALTGWVHPARAG